MGILGFQAIVTVVMVILAVAGLIGYYKNRNTDKK